MPYSDPNDPKLPANVKKMPAKKRRQWIAVWNSSFDKHHDESRAFAAANSVAGDPADHPVNKMLRKKAH